MTLPHDLALQRLESMYRSSISHQLARYVLAVDYDSLPPEVVHQAKRILLDTLGCAIGASEAPGRFMAERAVRALGGTPEATVFGSGLRTTAVNATLVNCFMVRYLDCNDLGGGGHNSDSIPPILAVAERERASGRSFLTAVVLSYEIGERIAGRVEESGRHNSLEERWNPDCRAGLSVPPPLGKLIGLNEEQIANAVGIAGAHAPSLGILDGDREEMAMGKNLRFGFAAQHALLACLMAKEGFTGFRRVVEGERGFNALLYNNEMDLERLVDFSGWRILGGSFKTICHNWTSHGHILATLALVKEHDLQPSDIAAVRIKAAVRDARHVTALARKYPRNTETATHSAFFANAIVIKDRAFGPAQLKPEKFNDPVVLDLIEKISVEADPSLPYMGPAGSSEIVTVDGRRFQKLVEVPHGQRTDPLTDGEVEEKFRDYAGPHMDSGHIQSIIDMVWDIDRQDTMDGLARLMVWL